MTMTYEYGSITLGIQNPFKPEGMIKATLGLLIFGLGLFCLLSVQEMVEGGLRTQGWLYLGAGILFMGSGIGSLGSGLFQVMRFFAGRGVPKSLAKNISKSECQSRETGVAYSAQDLERMLQGRKNITFQEPVGWIPRMVHTLFPKTLYLPYPYRNLIQLLSENILLTFLAISCFMLAWFSGTTGLTNITKTPAIDWLATLLISYLVFVWWRIKNPLSKTLQRRADSRSNSFILVSIIASIFLPVLLGYIHHNLIVLPETSFDKASIFIALTGLIIITFILLVPLIRIRVRLSNPTTEVSELRDNWQESIHPQELFIHFETITMANRRYKEVPNRVYREFDLNLIEEGSDDKGHFRGESIQETQPAFRVLESPVYTGLKWCVTIMGHALLCLSCFLLFFNLKNFAGTMGSGFSAQTIINDFGTILFIVIVWLFGRAWSNISHLFWAEMQFTSLMVFFQCQGTYSESKLSTGTSIYDSTRSENIVVRSSMTPWLLTCKIVSSCFAESGRANFEHPRHIMEMHSAANEHNAIIRELFDFFKQRETIAGIKTPKDLNATYNLHRINEQSRGQLNSITKITGQIELDQDSIEESAGIKSENNK